MSRAQSLENAALMGEAYALWMACDNLSEVARSLKIPLSTVSKWKELHHWEERRNRVQGIINAEIDRKVLEARMDMIVRIDRMMTEVSDRFGEAKLGTVKDMSSAFVELGKFRELLTGGATEREEKTVHTESVDWSSIWNAMRDTASDAQTIDISTSRKDRLLQENTDKIASQIADLGIEMEEDVSDVALSDLFSEEDDISEDDGNEE